MAPLQGGRHGCRAIRWIRPTPAPDCIWITDAVLSRAIQSYLAVSPAARRFASFVPGPLESRRRIGKRHMNTALYSFQVPSLLPPWAFEVSDNIERWIWEAPTVRWMRQRRSADAVKESLRERASGWISGLLVGREGVKSFDEMVGDAGIPFGEFLAGWVADIKTTEIISWREERAVPLFEEVKLLLRRRKVSTDQLCHLVKALFSALKHQNRAMLSAGTVTKAELDAMTDAALSQLFKTVIDAIATSPITKPSELEFRLWKLLMKNIRTLKGQAQSAELLRLLLQTVPKVYLDHLGGSVSAALRSFEPVLDTQPGDIVLPLQEEAVSIAAALKSYQKDSLMRIFKRAVHVQQQNPIDDPSRPYKLWCLSILARCQIRPPDLSWAVQWLFGSSDRRRTTEAPSAAEMSYLWALQWGRRGVTRIGEDEFSLLQSNRIATLAQLTIFICQKVETKRQVPALLSICAFLASQGQLEFWVNSWTAYCMSTEILTKMDARAMALVAIACNDYRLAIRLHRILKANHDKFKGGHTAMDDAWDWQVGQKYLKEVSLDPEIPLSEKWMFLAVHPTWKGRWVPRSSSAEPADRRKEATSSRTRINTLRKTAKDISSIVAKMDPQHATSSAQERTMLMCLESRIRWLTRQGVPLDRCILEPLARVLLRDLARGKPGRKARIKWLLGLIAEHLGPEEARVAGRQIGQWRDENIRIRTEAEMDARGTEAAWQPWTEDDEELGAAGQP